MLALHSYSLEFLSSWFWVQRSDNTHLTRVFVERTIWVCLKMWGLWGPPDGFVLTVGLCWMYLRLTGLMIEPANIAAGACVVDTDNSIFTRPFNWRFMKQTIPGQSFFGGSSRIKNEEEIPSLDRCHRMLPNDVLRSELRQADSAYSTVGILASWEIHYQWRSMKVYWEKTSMKWGGFPMLCLNTRGYHQFLEPLYMNFVWSYEMYDWGRDYWGQFGNSSISEFWWLFKRSCTVHCDPTKSPKESQTYSDIYPNKWPSGVGNFH